MEKNLIWFMLISTRFDWNRARLCIEHFDGKRNIIGVFLIRSLNRIKFQLTIQTQPEIIYEYHHRNSIRFETKRSQHIDVSH